MTRHVSWSKVRAAKVPPALEPLALERLKALRESIQDTPYRRAFVEYVQALQERDAE